MEPINKFQNGLQGGSIIFKREKSRIIIGVVIIFLALVLGGSGIYLTLYGLRQDTKVIYSVEKPTPKAVPAEQYTWEKINVLYNEPKPWRVPLEKNEIIRNRFFAGMTIGFTLFLFFGGLWYATHKTKFRVTEGKLKLDPEYELRFRGGLTSGFLLILLFIAMGGKFFLEELKHVPISSLLSVYIFIFVNLFAASQKGQRLGNIFIAMGMLGMVYEAYLLVHGDIGIIDAVIASSLYVYYFKKVADLKKYQYQS